MNITKKNKIILIAMISTLHMSSMAQIQGGSIDTLPYIQELKQALFPPDEPKINAKDHPNCKEEDKESWEYRELIEIDTVIMVRLFQPDRELVCSLLLEIARTKNYAYFKPLMDMYERHQKYYQEEWEYIKGKTKYACKAKSDPITIMQGFEHTLYALELAHNNVSQDEMIRLYDKEVQSFYEYIYFRADDHKIEMQKRKEIDDQINYYSPYFKKLRGRAWAAYGSGFSFSTPFLDLLEDHIVEKIRRLDVQMHKATSKENFEYFLQKKVIQSTILDMRHLSSRKFEQALQEKYEDIVQVGWSYDISMYVQLNQYISPEFVTFILDRSFEGQRLIDDYNRIGSFTTSFAFLIQDHTRPVIKEYLLKKMESDNSMARAVTLNSLIYYSNDPEVLQLMVEKSKQKNLSPEESKILRYNFDRMLKAPDFPEESKDAVRQSLKNLPHEKQ